MNEKKSPCTYIQYFKEKYSLDIQVNIFNISRAGNFRMVDIGINSWSTLFLNLQIKYCLLSSWI